MRRVATVIGWLALTGAAGLILLGIISWPPGGLMFALPFVFLVPGFILSLVGGVLVWLGRRSAAEASAEPENAGAEAGPGLDA